MRAFAATLPSKNFCKQIVASPSGWGGIAPSLEPKKQEKNGNSKGQMNRNEEVDPIVAFSKPPPLPPVIGPLVAFSLLDSFFNHHDSNEA